jgi:low temperature requirement protein LtrA
MMVAGPAVYLIGESLVRLRINNTLSPRRLLAVFALGLLGVLGGHLPALALSIGVATILVGLTVWDHERSRSASGPLAWVSVHRGAWSRRSTFTTKGELCE